MKANSAPLAGLRVIESSILGPAALGGLFADLGAEVIKVESITGDYIRKMTWPIIEGTSLMHYHVNRGKKSITLNLKTPEGASVYRDLIKDADIAIEAMRAGTLEKLGLGYSEHRKVNRKIVFCSLSGYGDSGPYRNIPSHGIAYDAWAGIIEPSYDAEGFCYIPDHIPIGIFSTPQIAAFSVLAGVIRARATGEGCRLDIGQSDGAAYFDWNRIESWKAYQRPEDVVTGNAMDNFQRRAPGAGDMKEGVRYQFYESADGHVLFMASERPFWKNFCHGLGRMDLYDRWPGVEAADHARGNRELRRELRALFKTRKTQEWLTFSQEHNTPIAPVNTPQSIVDDPQFQHRFAWMNAERHGADMLTYPVHFNDEELPLPSKAPTLGQHTELVLREILHYDEARIDALRAAGAVDQPHE